MKKLTEYQKSFLLNYFFKNENFAGWKNIADRLLESGKCIVPGKECIWIGGIGNFIKVTNTKEAIGCVLYTFDLDYFLTSNWYKEIHNEYKIQLSVKKKEIDFEYGEISNM